MHRLINHILSGLLIVLVTLILSCSPKTLSIFFDGVPNPDDSLSVFTEQPSQKAGAKQVNEMPAKETKVRYFFHAPYNQKECASCHDTKVMGALLEPLPGLCYQCHDDFSKTNSVLHAPVEAGECLSCHKPHLSNIKDLLIKPGQQLCFECHDAESIIQTEYHADIGNDDCTDCHNPHGGNERYFFN